MTIAYHTLSNVLYSQKRFDFIKAVEETNNVSLTAYDDNGGNGGGNPTIGIGMNLSVSIVRNAVTEVISGLSGQDLEDLSDEVGSIVAEYNNNIVQLNNNLNQALQDAGVEKDFTFANEAEVKEAFDIIAPFFENILNNWNAGIPESSERVALFSLAWNTPSLLGNNLKVAIDNGDRGAAWYEIRYESNGGASAGLGIAKRRYYEADTFGLYDNEGNVTETQAGAIGQVVTEHKQDILDYEQRYDSQIAAANSDYGTNIVKTYIASLQPAVTKLTAEYAPGRVYNDLVVDYGSPEKNELVGDIEGENKDPLNDLIFGLEGKNTLTGGDGNDALFGDEEDDQLNGEKGDDLIAGYNGKNLLIGGIGKDTIHGGEHNSTVYAGEGSGKGYGSDDGNVDEAIGGDGAEKFYVGQGDKVWGGLGNDTIYAINAEHLYACNLCGKYSLRFNA